MDEMLRAYGSLKSWSPSTSVHPPKSLANAYEAYLGLVFRDVMVKKRPLTDLQEYFSQLLTSEVFPDLEEQIQSFIAHQSEGQPHREYTNTKRQRQCKSSSGLRKSARIAKINASKVSNSNHTITAQIPDEVIAQRPEGIKQPTRVNTPEQLVSSAMAAGSGEEIATRSEEVQQVVQLNSPSQVSPPVLAGEPTDASPSLLPPLLAASTPVPSLPEPPSHGNEDDCREFIVRLGRAELEVLGYNTELVAVPRAWIVDALELLQE